MDKARTPFLLTFAITLGVLAASGVLAWTGPSASAPSGNAPAPLNASNAGQIKVGGLQLNTGGAATGLIVGGATQHNGTTTVSGGSINGSFGILPNYVPWNTYGTGAGGAAIYNDSGTYKTLMIVGNNSAGGVRNVGIWDNLNVNGAITSNNVAVCLQNGTNCPAVVASQWTTSGSNIYYNTGNVGIGTAGPASKLSVVGGDIRTDSAIYTRDLSVGGAAWPGVNNAAIAGRVSIGAATGITGTTLDIVTNGANDGIAFKQNADNSSAIQTYIDGQYANRTTYASGCCNLLQLNPDVGDVQVGGSVTVTRAGAVTGVSSLTVSGQSVCLANGTNCPAAANTTVLYGYTPTGNWDTDFQNTPARAERITDTNGGTNAPTGGGWWFTDNMRHSNGGNYWGVQMAYGWEDKANQIWTRNVSGNSFGAWYQIAVANGGTYNLVAANANAVPWTGITGKPYAFNQSTDVNAAPQFGRVYDDDASYYMDLNTTSRINALTAVGAITAPSFTDYNDGSYYVDPNNTTRMNGLVLVGGLDVGNAGGAYTYITLRDDESPNGVKYIHANSNLIGFLSGGGAWLSRWDNSGNEVVTGTGSFGGSVTVGSATVGTNGDLYMPWAGQWLSSYLGTLSTKTTETFGGMYTLYSNGSPLTVNAVTNGYNCPSWAGNARLGAVVGSGNGNFAADIYYCTNF